MPKSHSTTPTTFGPAATMTAYMDAVRDDLIELEQKYSPYLEQESLKGDVQCLRSWIEGSQKGDAEAVEYLQEHGTALLENIKSKLQAAAREIQRIDEESPVGGHFSGAKSDRLNCAATTALHAEDHLAKALHDETPLPESRVIAK